jgi:ubiquinone biosynthesis monooxygenase Coq7
VDRAAPGELNSHISVLNPLFYAGAYALGTVAAVLGDARSLGFVVETERQVEAHLESHLDRLPPQDANRAPLSTRCASMKSNTAPPPASGAAVPAPQRMSAMGKVMTGTAYYI